MVSVLARPGVLQMTHLGVEVLVTQERDRVFKCSNLEVTKQLAKQLCMQNLVAWHAHRSAQNWIVQRIVVLGLGVARHHTSLPIGVLPTRGSTMSQYVRKLLLF